MAGSFSKLNSWKMYKNKCFGGYLYNCGKNWNAQARNLFPPLVLDNSPTACWRPTARPSPRPAFIGLRQADQRDRRQDDRPIRLHGRPGPTWAHRALGTGQFSHFLFLYEHFFPQISTLNVCKYNHKKINWLAYGAVPDLVLPGAVPFPCLPQFSMIFFSERFYGAKNNA